MSLLEHDTTQYAQARDNSFQDLLVYAAKKSGRSPLQITREFRQLSKAQGRINMVEYVRTGLYDINRFSAEERAQFISNDLHWPIAHMCNTRSWQGASEDKVVAGTLLSASGVPVPETLGVLDTSQRVYPGLEKIGSAEGLRNLLNERPGQALFCKVVDGMVSFGAFRIEACDAETITCTGHAPMSHARFMSEFVGDKAYVVQRELINHPTIAPYASFLATVRMVNLVTRSGVKCPAAVIKLPQGGNIADAFWRPGNIACAIDPETGRIRTVARRGIEMEYLADHPEVAGLMGLQLPFWSELREINERAALTFAPIRYQSTDIAITATGPVVVELNYGGGFDLPQYAGGRGLLTPEVQAFFEGCGVVFGEKPKRRFPFVGR
ncbi:MAG: hypothetical protein MUF63_14265 [Rhodobacteraceae bacterium]|jgi:hypothetical protein|nr:hypothetical protein [Paracoccaceae bacterium]